MARKGISPLLSAVLLVAVTISVAGIFSGWAPGLASTVTDETEADTEHQLDCEDASLELISAHYDGSNLNVSIRNRGRANLSNVILAAFDSNDQILNQKTGIEVQNITSEELSVSSKPSYITGYSDKCGSVEHKLEDISG